MKPTLVLGLGLLGSGIADAQAISITRGAGSDKTCAYYLAAIAKKGPEANVLQQWVLAFVTGWMAYHSFKADDPTVAMRSDDILKAIKSECTVHPENLLVDVLTGFAYAASTTKG